MSNRDAERGLTVLLIIALLTSPAHFLPDKHKPTKGHGWVINSSHQGRYDINDNRKNIV